VFARMKDRVDPRSTAAALQWYRRQVEPFQDYVESLDPALWIETAAICDEFARSAENKLRRLDLKPGGGAHFPLLYFLTRLLDPATVVETGVAAGWSSQSILLSLRKNGSGGRLYSSDFPYFRYHNPERLVGVLVDQELKGEWSLYIDGDRTALPVILLHIDSIDIFHYDSDKTYDGRDFAFTLVEPKLTDTAIILFDDIQDNSHFYDLVNRKRWQSKVFDFQGKLVGMTGPFLSATQSHDM